MYSSKQSGFTLIELMIVVAIVGILASLAVSSYQTYTVRSQVAEGIRVATYAKAGITEAFVNRGEAPANRTQSGLTPNATDTQGTYVSAVDIINGEVEITFGNRANAQIAGATLYLTPYETPDRSIVWRCANAPVPAGTQPMGTAGGGTTAAYTASTVANQFLPSSCR